MNVDVEKISGHSLNVLLRQTIDKCNKDKFQTLIEFEAVDDFICRLCSGSRNFKFHNGL